MNYLQCSVNSTHAYAHKYIHTCACLRCNLGHLWCCSQIEDIQLTPLYILFLIIYPVCTKLYMYIVLSTVVRILIHVHVYCKTEFILPYNDLLIQCLVPPCVVWAPLPATLNSPTLSLCAIKCCALASFLIRNSQHKLNIGVQRQLEHHRASLQLCAANKIN